ncbi:MAG: hypothetical protein HY314_00305 [Acidobacteria bacterium]|nr:hypothetical protein [Acidobacteriota bacterium]
MRILIAEDDPVSRRVLEVTLTRWEYEVVIACDGTEAGADDYVTKPFDRDELHARVQVGARVVELQRALASRVRELEEALSRVKLLEGILPICSYCKQVRDDRNYWQQVESYITDRSEVRFSHSICPACYMDGWRFCRLLRSPEYAACNNIPVLVVSATFSGTEAEQVTTNLGANAFLHAPCDPSSLRACVRALLDGQTTPASMRVLIVEDDQALLQMLQRAFQAHGFAVTVALTGEGVDHG